MVYVVIVPRAYLLSKHLSNWTDQAPAQFIYWISLCFRQFTNDNGLETNITTSIALSTGSICASLGMIPNQPIVFKVGCVIKVTYLTLTDRWNGCFNNSYKPFSGLCLLFYLYILICVGICIICDIQYTYVVGKYMQTKERREREWRAFLITSQRVQIHFIFTDNVRILCLSCNFKSSRVVVVVIIW